MFKTGQPFPDGLTGGRQLLSLYDTSLTLDRYVQYDTLRTATHKAFATEAGSEARAAANAEFFRLMHASLEIITAYLVRADAEADTSTDVLTRTTADELRGRGKPYFAELFVGLHRLMKYREVNSMCFRKAMEKFMGRCGRGDLAVQEQLHELDATIARSTLGAPALDIGEAMDHVATVVASVFGLTFEAAMAEMQLAVRRDRNEQPRVPPLSSAYYFQKKYAHRQAQGSFGVKILAGSTSSKLAKHIGQLMRSSNMINAKMGQFANSEVSIRIAEAVRGDDVFIVQSMVATDAASLSASLMELLLSIQTVTLASAARVTAVIPYMAYTQRTGQAGMLAEHMMLMGCQRVVTLDMYREQVEGMFGNVPVDNISCAKELLSYLISLLRSEERSFENLTVVAANADVVAKARGFADSLMKMAKLDDKRQFIGVATAVQRVGAQTVDIIGDVAGRTCIVLDNAIDEGINLDVVARRLDGLGAASVMGVATHAIFSGDCVKRLVDSPLDLIIVSDTVNRLETLRDPALAKKLRFVPVAPLLAQAIDRIHSDANTETTLFEK